MPCSDVASTTITRALAGALIFQEDILTNLTKAKDASNPASAAQFLHKAKEDADALKRRIDLACAEVENDARNQEEAPVKDFIETLKRATAPKSHLRVV